MRGTAFTLAPTLALALIATPLWVQDLRAQDVGQGNGRGGATSGSPAGGSSEAPDLASYEKLLQDSRGKLRAAASQPGVKDEFSKDESVGTARREVLTVLQDSLGIVRRAPASYKERPVYKQAESQIQAASHKVQGQQQDAALAGPMRDAVQAVETLVRDVGASHGRG